MLASLTFVWQERDFVCGEGLGVIERATAKTKARIRQCYYQNLILHHLQLICFFLPVSFTTLDNMQRYVSFIPSAPGIQ